MSGTSEDCSLVISDLSMTMGLSSGLQDMTDRIATADKRRLVRNVCVFICVLISGYGIFLGPGSLPKLLGVTP